MTSFNPYRHTVPLLIATGKTFGGLMPFWNSQTAIHGWGLPSHIAASEAAQLIFLMFGSRETMIGAVMWISYVKGYLRTVDIMMAALLYVETADAYVCLKAGEVKSAWFRGLLGVFAGGWGLLGITAGGMS